MLTTTVLSPLFLSYLKCLKTYCFYFVMTTLVPINYGQLVRALGLQHGEYGFEPRPRQLLCRDLEQVLCTQLLCNTTASAPPRSCVSGNTYDWCALREALYKCIDTIQYRETWLQ